MNNGNIVKNSPCQNTGYLLTGAGVPGMCRTAGAGMPDMRQTAGAEMLNMCRTAGAGMPDLRQMAGAEMLNMRQMAGTGISNMRQEAGGMRRQKRCRSVAAAWCACQRIHVMEEVAGWIGS